MRPTGLCQRCTYSGTADTSQKRIKYLYITEATLACLWQTMSGNETRIKKEIGKILKKLKLFIHNLLRIIKIYFQMLFE